MTFVWKTEENRKCHNNQCPGETQSKAFWIQWNVSKTELCELQNYIRCNKIQLHWNTLNVRISVNKIKGKFNCNNNFNNITHVLNLPLKNFLMNTSVAYNVMMPVTLQSRQIHSNTVLEIWKVSSDSSYFTLTHRFHITAVI